MRTSNTIGMLYFCLTVTLLLTIAACDLNNPPSDTNIEKQDPQAIQSAFSPSGAFRVTYVSRPEPIPLNQTFSLNVRVEAVEKTQNDAQLSVLVDAEMPEHQHGMKQQPKITAQQEGFLVEGMLFHMPGEWVIHVDIKSAEKTERVSFTVNM
ncbi:MAG: hypothetical protein AAGJ35_11275 [Myxococcota bacterium]